MYNGKYEIEDYEPYVDGNVAQTAVVLAWSKANGYHFKPFSTMTADDKLIAVRS